MVIFKTKSYKLSSLQCMNEFLAKPFVSLFNHTRENCKLLFCLQKSCIASLIYKIIRKLLRKLTAYVYLHCQYISEPRTNAICRLLLSANIFKPIYIYICKMSCCVIFNARPIHGCVFVYKAMQFSKLNSFCIE